MNHAITFQPAIPTRTSFVEKSRHAVACVVYALREALAVSGMHPRTRYLSQARDHVELERRMRVWEAREAHQAAMFRSGIY